MRIVVVGLGTQGLKRKKHAGNDFVASADPYNDDAEYHDISEIPLKSYDELFCIKLLCLPFRGPRKH